MSKMAQKNSKLDIFKILIEIIVGLFFIISGIWSVFYLFIGKPQAERIVQLENKNSALEFQETRSNSEIKNSEVKKCQNIKEDTNSNSILFPTWISIPGGIGILDGKGLMSLRNLGDEEIYVTLLLPKSSWVNFDGLKLKGASMKFLPGNRFLFTYDGNRYAVDLLALEKNRARLSIVILK